MNKNLCLAGIWGCLAALAPALSAAELGEPAAPLEIAEWVKGDAVDLAAVKGKKVVVVEFWATWCGPCRVSIPHLTELQKKFSERGVVFVGVSDEASAKVKAFVDEQGEKMDYTVAIDQNRKTSAGYMGAYGINGIPHAFIVDLEGRVAWHGHPMSGLDTALDKIAPKEAVKPAGDNRRDVARRKLLEYSNLAGQGAAEAQLDKLGQELAALDKELGGIEPNRKLDLAETRKQARFQAIMRDYQRALTSGKEDAELEKLEAQARPLAPAGFNFAKFKGQYQLQRVFQDYYRAVTGRGDQARVDELAGKLAALESDTVEMQTEIAWTLLTDERIKTRNLKLAMKFAKAAFDACEGKDVNALDTYARALFDTGKTAEAVGHVKKAIALCNEKDRRAELEEALKHYQEKEKAPGQ